MQERPMVTDPRFDTRANEHDEPPKQWSWLTTCLVGCAIMLGLAIVVAAIGGFWVARNWRGWASSMAAIGIKQGIDESQLPAEEKIEIKAQVDRVTDAFNEGQLSLEQFGTIVELLAQSPLFTSLIATAADSQYIAKSGLSDEEKTEGRRNLRRFVRGVVDDKINEQQMETVLANIADKQSDGSWRLRNQVSDEDLRKFLDAAKTEADAAGIAEEPIDIDPSDEVKKIIDEVMIGPAGGVPEIPLPRADDMPEIDLPNDGAPPRDAPAEESTENAGTER